MRTISDHSIDEKKLIRRALKGKASAQQLLFERHSPKMLSLCLRYTGNRFEADDVLVMAFTRVFDKLNTYKHEGSFEGWVRRIVVNEALGYLRKHRKHHFEEIEEVEYAGMYVAPSQDLEVEALHELVRQLPEGYRTVFNLYAIEGFSHKEIAERLQISVGTSKSQLNRARTLLKSQLAKLEKNEY